MWTCIDDVLSYVLVHITNSKYMLLQQDITMYLLRCEFCEHYISRSGPPRSCDLTTREYLVLVSVALIDAWKAIHS